LYDFLADHDREDLNKVKTLLKAVFLLAFNAFLRLGEILVRSPKEAGSVIQKQDATNLFCDRETGIM
jgi:hypothetical protein